MENGRRRLAAIAWVWAAFSSQANAKPAITGGGGGWAPLAVSSERVHRSPPGGAPSDAPTAPPSAAASVAALPLMPPGPKGACGNLCMTARWLGCLFLHAEGPNAELFGGISGAALLPPSRLLLVSDAGRMFSADLLTEEVVGGVSRPIGLGRVYVGGEQTEEAHDMESVAVRRPSGDAFIGVEHILAVERFAGIEHFNLPESLAPAKSAALSVAPAAPGAKGAAAEVPEVGGEVGKALTTCRSHFRNQGPEAVAVLRGGAEGGAGAEEGPILFVACERNAPGAPINETLAWAAEATTGAIRAKYTLELPEVKEVLGAFYRVAGVARLPGTEDLLVLFGFWSLETGNRVMLGRIRPPVGLPGTPAVVRLRPAIVLELDGGDDRYCLDNFEAVFVQRSVGGAFVVHLVSDDNFNEGGGNPQRTLLLTALLEDVGEKAPAVAHAADAALGAATGAPAQRWLAWPASDAAFGVARGEGAGFGAGFVVVGVTGSAILGAVAVCSLWRSAAACSAHAAGFTRMPLVP